MKHISSRDNPFFKELKKLASSTRQRRKAGLALLDGIHLLQSCLISGNAPLHIVLTESANQDQEVTALLKEMPSVPVTQLNDSLFAELSELKTPGGVLAVIELPQPAVSIAHSRFCLLLEDIQDPGNLGSIVRSAAAAGCDAVFLSKGCADVWSSKVLRAGMGGHFFLGIHESADLIAMAEAFQGTVFAGVLGAKRSVYKCDLRGQLAFAVGNEGAGLSASLLAIADEKLSIPMAGQIESLNVAVATAVCLFEAVRQRTP